MFRLSLTRRTLVTFALAAALAAPATLVAADAGADHQQCEREGHPCGSAIHAPCCCHVGPADQPTPASPPSGRTALVGLDAAPLTVAAFLVASIDADSVSSAVLRLHSPPHGYCFADLSILLSILLI